MTRFEGEQEISKLVSQPGAARELLTERFINLATDLGQTCPELGIEILSLVQLLLELANRLFQVFLTHLYLAPRSACAAGGHST